MVANKIVRMSRPKLAAQCGDMRCKALFDVVEWHESAVPSTLEVYSLLHGALVPAYSPSYMASLTKLPVVT